MTIAILRPSGPNANEITGRAIFPPFGNNVESKKALLIVLECLKIRVTDRLRILMRAIANIVALIILRDLSADIELLIITLYARAGLST
jgi:hypothetical protein